MDWGKSYVQSYVQSQLAGTTYELYQQAHGGIIYYLDSSKQHGLVTATSDSAYKPGNQKEWSVNYNYDGAV